MEGVAGCRAPCSGISLGLFACPSRTIMPSTYTLPPDFKKKKHHYVSKFWMRRFRDVNKQLWQWDGQNVERAATSKIMQIEWLYTVYDDWWRPSDSLENQLSKVEGNVARVYSEVETLQGADVQKLLPDLSQVLALQACRHPNILFASHRKVAILANLLADAPLHDSESSFVEEAKNLGVPEVEAQEMYAVLSKMNPDELAVEAEEVRLLSPQDPQLPMVEALHAWPDIATLLSKLSYEVLDAPAGSTFVLGDTPLAQGRLGPRPEVQAQLSAGFIVPFTKSVAVHAYPDASPAMSRRTATAAEVQTSNVAQWKMAEKLVVGADPNVLQALGLK